MSVYLSRIEIINGYSNIRPVMEMIDDGLVEVDDEKFGQYGTITIGALYGTESPFIQDQQYCIFTLSDQELSDLEQTTSGYKIRAQDFLMHCKAVDSSAIRELIPLPNTIKTCDYNSWSKTLFPLAFIPMTKTVYLSDDDSILGPFSWVESANRQFSYVPCASGNDPYILQCYKKDDFEDPIYTFDAAKRQQDILYGRTRNAITLDSLPSKFKPIDCIDDKGLKDFVGRLLAQPLETKKEKKDIKDTITALPVLRISDDRKHRILELVKNGEISDQAMSSIISDVFRSDDTAAIEQIVKKVLDNVNYSDQLLQIARSEPEFKKILNILDKEKETKKAEIKELDTKIEATKKSTNGEVVPPAEIAKLKDERDELKNELSKYKSLDEANAAYDQAQKRTADEEAQYKALTKLTNNLKSEIDDTVQSAYAHLAFDGPISSLMLQKAAQYERENHKQELSTTLATIASVDKSSQIVEPTDLVKFLHQELTQKANRTLTMNDVANLLICLSQGFLTMLAGDPGTGKTSLVELLSRMLGLTDPYHMRFSEIAVEKGWSSRRDLIGYYNPLTKSFDAANKSLFSALDTLNVEATNGIADFPYLVLLDEANLSQMEHYWADFMGLCDLDKQSRKISLSEDYEFLLPETLRFVGTINLDHTTESLSPRLIDRSWIIKLQAVDLDIDDYVEPQINAHYPMVRYSAFKKLRDFGLATNAKLDTAISEKFNRIRSIFQNVGIGFSPRILGMIKRYCLAANEIMDTSDNSYIALDYAIAQKVLPMIDGYGEPYQKMLDELLKECDQNTMPKCYGLLKSIQNKGFNNMQYYQFFAR